MTFKPSFAFIAAMVWAGVAVACPNWEAPPSFGSIELREGFPNDPYQRRITAGGRYNLSSCLRDNSVSGTVASAPDFDLYYTTSGNTPLTIYVRSSHDTVLLISDPYGNWWFDDDSGGGHDPLIYFPNAANGLYNIWIGSFESRSGLPGTLIFTER
jgi:hypothetical protein